MPRAEKADVDCRRAWKTEALSVESMEDRMCCLGDCALAEMPECNDGTTRVSRTSTTSVSSGERRVK